MQALLVALIVLAVGAGTGLGFRPENSGSPMLLVLAGAPTLFFGVAALARARKEGYLGDWLRPRWGDFSVAALSAVLLFASAYAFSRFVAPPGSPRHLWLVSFYAELGDPRALQAHAVPIGLAIVLLALMEEVVWRGYVTDALAERFGSRRAWLASAALYAIAHAPTMWSLRSGGVLNPLLPIAALGIGLVCGLLARRDGRLLPAVIAHALFDWIVVMMFPLWSAPHLG